jgi:hypothetical protein
VIALLPSFPTFTTGRVIGDRLSQVASYFVAGKARTSGSFVRSSFFSLGCPLTKCLQRGASSCFHGWNFRAQAP